MAEPSLCSDPNKHARSAKVDLGPLFARFFGYQEFVVTPYGLQVSESDQQLVRKKELLSRYFTKRYLANRSFLDLGANSGFYSFWSLLSGAKSATAVDLDTVYIEIVGRARDHLGFLNLETVVANVIDWKTSAAIVNALALVHWMYACTTELGSLSKVIKHLADLTEYMLLVEWIEPDDPAIGFFGHLDWNPDKIEEPYTFEFFERALQKYFVRIETVGVVSGTRRLYAAFKYQDDIDLLNPLPHLFDEKLVISSKLLTSFDDIDYWCRVYSLPEKGIIVKQATLDLASREYIILNQLSSRYFPKALSYKEHDGFSEVTIEYIEGDTLDQVLPQLSENPNALREFIEHCLNILLELEKQGIMHRDLYPSNLKLRDGIPVLFDFGWAVSTKNKYLSPNELGHFIIPTDRSFSDVFAMGKLLEEVVEKVFPQVLPVIRLMTANDVSLRIDNLEIIRYLLNITLENALAMASSEQDGNGTNR